ncbi:MAG TPA: hypothetical protein DD381_05480 [Lentisphaeria bacterium]|nr:MAG: hypothetical protein A2X47_06980 [Lentisphaerae bacterium GWF2_38_69]HBM15782.1 hypothetical protein [Lentisphaeria bacterium]
MKLSQFIGHFDKAVLKTKAERRALSLERKKAYEFLQTEAGRKQISEIQKRAFASIEFIKRIRGCL